MLLDEEAMRDAFLRAAAQTSDGSVEAASETILNACGGMVNLETKAQAVVAYMLCTGLIVIGTDICAVAVRSRAGDPAPWAPPNRNITFALDVSALDDGDTPLSDDPCWNTAMGCVNAGLNQDFGMLANSLSAHVEVHGLDTFPGIVSDLITFYLAITDPETLGESFSSGQ